MLKIEKININNAPVFRQSVKKQDNKYIGNKKLTETLDGLAVNNSVIVKPAYRLIDEKVELLEGYDIKPLNKDLSNLSPQNAVLVHATDYFPNDETILSTANAAQLETGKINPKYKIHFAINHFVKDHSMGNWGYRKYAILMPMDKIMETMPKENILGGAPIDFFIQGNVKLPKESVIIKMGSKDVPKGKMKVSDLRNDIKLIETSRTDTADFTNEIIKKTGYTHYNPDFLQDENKAKINKNEYEAWENFCKKFDFENAFHSHSPWGRSETIFVIIDTLKDVSESWIYYKKDYQKMLLSVIEDIKKTLPKGKRLDFDIDKLFFIIENSKTPKGACKEIEEKLNIKYTNDYFEAKKIIGNSKNYKEAEEKIKKAGLNYPDYFVNLDKKELDEEYQNNFQDFSESVKEGIDWAYYLFLTQTGIELNDEKARENIELV